MTNVQFTNQASSLCGPAWADGPATEVLAYGAPRSRWHDVRATGIGGSDALAALNLSPYSTPYALWLDKTGRRSPKPANARMEWGNRLEHVAADWFAELEGKTLGFTGTWRHPAPLFEVVDPCGCGEDMIAAAGHADDCEGYRQTYARWALCNPDRYVVGENAGVEIKVVHPRSADVALWLDGEIPDYPRAQAQWCMGVTGAAAWYVVAMIDGRPPIWSYELRDDDLITDMREAAGQMIRDHVYADIAPPADASAATTEALAAAAMSRLSDGGEVDLGVQGWLMLAERRRIKAQQKLLTDQLREVENAIKAPLVEAGAEYGLIGGDRRFRLRVGERRAYSVKASTIVELREVAK